MASRPPRSADPNPARSSGDAGVGVPAAELPRIFERFYRGDRSRTGSGSSLGLSLARAFARAHGGDLTALSVQGAGCVFTLRLRRYLVLNSLEESVWLPLSSMARTSHL